MAVVLDEDDCESLSKKTNKGRGGLTESETGNMSKNDVEKVVL